MDFTGRTLVGKYRIEKLLGQGGMGTVWRGAHVLTGRKIAVKFLDEKFLTNSNVVQRFGREARAASSIAHEGIVEVLDLDTTEEGIPFLVMEFLEGRSLADRIDHGDRMTEEHVVEVGLQLLDALHAAHESGVVHRDLKPDNIYLVPGRRGERVKILDFGISSKSDEADAKLTVTGSVLGTPHYMSPEAAMGETVIDRRADVYAAGVVLYECAVGQVPFDGPNYNKLLRVILDGNAVPPRQRGARLRPEVEAVIMKALERRKEDRPNSAADMRDMLARAAKGLASLSEPPAALSGRTDESVAMRWLAAPLEDEPIKRAEPSRPEVHVPAAIAPPSGLAKSALDPLDDLEAVLPEAPAERGEPLAPRSGILEFDESALADRNKGPRTSRVGAQRPALGNASPPPAARSSSSGSVPAVVEGREGRPTAASPVPSPVTGSRAVVVEPEERPSVLRWAFFGTAALCGVALVAIGARTFLDRNEPVDPAPVTEPVDPTPEPPPTPPPTKVAPAGGFVSVIIELQPPGIEGARMRLDGIPGATSPIRVRRGTRHVLEVSAPGYLDQRVEIQAERDQRLPVALQPAS